MIATSKRAVIYLRISVDRPNETSTTTQRTLCEAYAAQRGWSVVAVLDDIDKSAYKPNIKRPGFDQAIRMVETGVCDVLIVFKLDRFTRNAVDFLAVWKRIEKAGGEFASVTESFDTTTAAGRLNLFTIASMAEMESESKRARMLPWHELRVGLGLPPAGPKPFGYQRTPNALTIDESEASFLREAIAMILDGQSLRSINAKFKSTGMVGPNTESGWRLLMLSPTNASLRRCKSTGVVTDGNWEPIITRETWEAVCAVLSNPNRRTSFNQGKRTNLLSGLMVCANCNIGVQILRHASGKRYSCKQCKSSCFGDMADEFVSTSIIELVSDDAWNELRTRGHGFDPTVIAAMEAEALELAMMHQAGSISLAQFVVMNDGLKARMLTSTESAAVELPNIESLRDGWAGLDVDAKRLVLSAVTTRIALAPHANRTCMGTERIAIEW